MRFLPAPATWSRCGCPHLRGSARRGGSEEVAQRETSPAEFTYLETFYGAGSTKVVLAPGTAHGPAPGRESCSAALQLPSRVQHRPPQVLSWLLVLLGGLVAGFLFGWLFGLDFCLFVLVFCFFKACKLNSVLLSPILVSVTLIALALECCLPGMHEGLGN